jgi:uncharacterized protein with GYD domain
MPTFVTQGRLTREYVKSGLAKPEDRHAAIAKLCEEAGGRLISLYFTLGQYDFLLISDMPDARAAARIGLAATGGGGLKVLSPLRPSRLLRRKSYLRAQERSPTSRWARPNNQ